MKSVYRVGVIEVGSRAIRLLVADVSPQGQLQNVLTSWHEIQLAAALDDDRVSIEHSVERAKQLIVRFWDSAKGAGPACIAAFGTEAVRRLGETQVKSIREICPDFRVLSKGEEAELSFLAGVMEIPEANRLGATSLVVDQGSGSMEVVIGTLGPREACINDKRSYKLGTIKLVELLAKAGSFKRMEDHLEEQFARYRPLISKATVRPIVLGSAATRLAWLTVRGSDILRPYDPLEVHGRVMQIGYIDSIVRLADADPTTARAIVQPRDPSSPDFERILAGLVALKTLLKREGKEHFVVSCKGTRYGLVWKLAFQEGLTINRSG